VRGIPSEPTLSCSGGIGEISDASLLRHSNALSFSRLPVMETPRSGGSQYSKTMVVMTLYHGAHSTTKRPSSKRHIYPIKFHPEIDLGIFQRGLSQHMDVVTTKLCTMCDLAGSQSLCAFELQISKSLRHNLRKVAPPWKPECGPRMESF
jgi:hypothetical protein